MLIILLLITFLIQAIKIRTKLTVKTDEQKTTTEQNGDMHKQLTIMWKFFDPKYKRITARGC